MGSGRGKNRRAQARGAGSAQTISFDKKKWDAFIVGSGLGDVGVLDYYTVPGRGRGTDERSCQKALQEIIFDAIAVGAIVVPGGFPVDDICVKIAGVGGPTPEAIIKEEAEDCLLQVADECLVYVTSAAGHTL